MNADLVSIGKSLCSESGQFCGILLTDMLVRMTLGACNRVAKFVQHHTGYDEQLDAHCWLYSYRHCWTHPGCKQV